MSKTYDLAVIGAGITGLGLFETASRAGLKVLILERGVPGRQTTGATSGLFHGGLRYLPYDAHTSLMMGRQAGLLSREYPKLVHRDVFLWPIYRGDLFGMELVETLLECYDDMSGLRSARKHVRLSARETLILEPGLRRKGLVGALAFDEWSVRVDGLVKSLIESGAAAGGTVLPGHRVMGFKGTKGRLEAAMAEGEHGRVTEHRARVFVNAGGPWSEEVAELAGVKKVKLTLRKGVHLVVKGRFPHALIFPDSEGRYIGLYPKGSEAWVGPSDDAFDGSPDGVEASEAEREKLLRAMARILPGLKIGPTRMTVGLRPLFGQRGVPGLFSRSHRIQDHKNEGLSNFITVMGGKLTTFRPMAEETLELVSMKLGRRGAKPPRAGAAIPDDFGFGLFEKHGRSPWRASP